MVKIPEQYHAPINGAFPANVCLVGTVSGDGKPQISLKGSVLVLDSDTVAFWERTWRGVWANLKENPNVTILYRNPALRETLLPAGGTLRIWGTAEVFADGPMRDRVWEKVVQPEKDRDPERKGAAVVVKIERAEHLNGKPLE